MRPQAATTAPTAIAHLLGIPDCLLAGTTMSCYLFVVEREARAPTSRSRQARGIRDVCVFEKSGGWWVAEFPPFPGAYSQGRTKAEAYRNLLSAMRDLVEAYAEQAAHGGARATG